jgi:hypothetical protein
MSDCSRRRHRHPSRPTLAAGTGSTLWTSARARRTIRGCQSAGTTSGVVRGLPLERSVALGVVGAMTYSVPPNGTGRADLRVADRGLRHAAVLVVGSTVTLTLLAAGLWVRAGLHLSSGIPAVIFPVVLAAAIAYAVASAVILVRRPERNVGWVLGALGLLVAAVYLGLAIVSLGTVGLISPGVAEGVALFSVSIVSSATVATGATFGFIFPTGHLRGRVGTWGIRAAWVGAGIVAAGHVLSPGPIFILRDLRNPLAPSGSGPVGAVLLGVGVAVLMVACFLAAVSLVARHRASDSTSRRQIRLVVGAAASLALSTFLFLATSYLGSSGPLRDLTTVLLAVTLLLSPIAILVAMIRYRLYELDRLVGRTFVIASLTAILAGAFAASQRLLQVVFVAVLGESSDLTYVFSTLLVVTAITPLKEHLEGVVDGWEDEEDPSAHERLPSGDTASPIAEVDQLDPSIVAIIDTRIEERWRVWLNLHDGPGATGTPGVDTETRLAEATPEPQQDVSAGA